VTDRRTLPVPEGLEGLRLDAALSRLLGLSRTAAADLIGTGAVQLDGSQGVKSDRVTAGAVLDVELPTPEAASTAVPEVVPGLRVVHEDDDVLVVDKPVGVAAHPSPAGRGPPSSAGWPRPATG
jgi:23S rRNA pseudouridine1911/1915/1917 synthase